MHGANQIFASAPSRIQTSARRWRFTFQPKKFPTIQVVLHVRFPFRKMNCVACSNVNTRSMIYVSGTSGNAGRSSAQFAELISKCRKQAPSSQTSTSQRRRQRQLEMSDEIYRVRKSSSSLNTPHPNGCFRVSPLQTRRQRDLLPCGFKRQPWVATDGKP